MKLSVSTLRPEDVENIERLNKIMGPTTLILLVFLILTIYVMYRVAMAYISNLKDQISAKTTEAKEWKDMFVGSMRGSRTVVGIADKLLDKVEPGSGQ